MSANPTEHPADGDSILRELWQIKDRLSSDQSNDPEKILRRHQILNLATKAGKISNPFPPREIVE